MTPLFGIRADKVRLEPGAAPVRDDLAARVQVSIERRACGQIRDLHVVCDNDQIILCGRSRTYHAKQLAQQAALDAADGLGVLTNQIVVS